MVANMPRLLSFPSLLTSKAMTWWGRSGSNTPVPRSAAGRVGSHPVGGSGPRGDPTDLTACDIDAQDPGAVCPVRGRGDVERAFGGNLRGNVDRALVSRGMRDEFERRRRTGHGRKA